MLLQTMPLESTLQLVEKYGLSAVILLVILFFCGFLVRFILKRFKAQDKRIDELIKSITHNDFDKIDEKLSIHANNSDKVHTLIYYMLNEFDADRISVFEFHNGGKTYSGVDFKKCSNTYEVVSLGIDNKYKDYQNIPISINALWYKLLVDKNMIIIEDVEKLMTKDITLYNLLSADNIKSYYSRLILDFDNKPLGFIVVSFYQKPEKLNCDQLKLLNDATFSIGSLINIK